MKRIYIAGKLRDNSVNYPKNLKKMLIEANKIMKAGFAVFVPGLDFLQAIVEGGFNYKTLFNNSQSWLEVSDALFVCDNWETSKGTKKEIKKAKKLDIPIFYNIEDLKKWRNQ